MRRGWRPVDNLERRHAVKIEVTEAIQLFDFAAYGMDDVDANSEYADWVEDLAKVITDRVLEV